MYIWPTDMRCCSEFKFGSPLCVNRVTDTRLSLIHTMNKKNRKQQCKKRDKWTNKKKHCYATEKKHTHTHTSLEKSRRNIKRQAVASENHRVWAFSMSYGYVELTAGYTRICVRQVQVLCTVIWKRNINVHKIMRRIQPPLPMTTRKYLIFLVKMLCQANSIITPHFMQNTCIAAIHRSRHFLLYYRNGPAIHKCVSARTAAHRHTQTRSTIKWRGHLLASYATAMNANCWAQFLPSPCKLVNHWGGGGRGGGHGISWHHQIYLYPPMYQYAPQN